MEHQYPGAISGDENMLAELMLPDQAHVRKQDWTIFFLHKDSGEEDEKEDGEEGQAKERQASNGTTNDMEAKQQGAEGLNNPTESTKDQDEMEGGEGPPLIYVLNLVNTVQDTSAQRCSTACPHTLWTSSDSSCAEVLYLRQWQFAQDIPFCTYIR